MIYLKSLLLYLESKNLVFKVFLKFVIINFLSCNLDIYLTIPQYFTYLLLEFMLTICKYILLHIYIIKFYMTYNNSQQENNINKITIVTWRLLIKASFLLVFLHKENIIGQTWSKRLVQHSLMNSDVFDVFSKS